MYYILRQFHVHNNLTMEEIKVLKRKPKLFDLTLRKTTKFEVRTKHCKNL